jgi:division protein CdvB (Snf7/Vps24/ESCRT-III family)
MISILHKSHNGSGYASLRDAYRQRLQEIATSSVEPRSSAEGAAKPFPAGEGTKAEAVGTPLMETLNTDSQQSRPTVAVAARHESADDGLDILKNKRSCGQDECWTEASRQTPLERSLLQKAIGNLDSLAGNAKSSAGRPDPVCVRAGEDHRDYRDMISRLNAIERKMESYESGLERLGAEVASTREHCEKLQQNLQTLSESVAVLERTVHSRIERLESSMNRMLDQITARFDKLSQCMAAQAESIGDAAAACLDARRAQIALKERMDQQAQALRLIHGATRAQAERWSQLKQAASGIAQLARSASAPMLAREEL